MKMEQTVFCLFCVLSLSFEKLPGRKIKEKKKASACAVPHQKTSVQEVKIGRSAFYCFCSFYCATSCFLQDAAKD